MEKAFLGIVLAEDSLPPDGESYVEFAKVLYDTALALQRLSGLNYEDYAGWVFAKLVPNPEHFAISEINKAARFASQAARLAEALCLGNNDVYDEAKAYLRG